MRCNYHKNDSSYIHHKNIEFYFGSYCHTFLFIGIDNVYTCILTLSYKRDILCPARVQPKVYNFRFTPRSKSKARLLYQEILSEALSIVDNKTAQQILAEKIGEKNYPIYFKALVKHGITNSNNPITIAKQGLHKAHHLFDYYRDGKHYLLKDALHIPTSTPLNTVRFKGESEAAPEWYVPYKVKTERAKLT